MHKYKCKRASFCYRPVQQQNFTPLGWWRRFGKSDQCLQLWAGGAGNAENEKCSLEETTCCVCVCLCVCMNKRFAVVYQWSYTDKLNIFNALLWLWGVFRVLTRAHTHWSIQEHCSGESRWRTNPPFCVWSGWQEVEITHQSTDMKTLRLTSWRRGARQRVRLD